MARDATPFSSGPVAPHHAAFGGTCTACHVQKSVLKSSVTNDACLACHDGPIHQEQQISAPDCVECHIEHKGPEKLLHAGDQACTACHADLKTRNRKLSVVAHIKSFGTGHPEFRPLRAGFSDPGGIKFNHKVHLKKDLKGSRGYVKLECVDCHRPNGTSQSWPYGTAEPAGETPIPVQPATTRVHNSARAYMQPINYYEHCSLCHPLLFDPRIAEPAPHKKPEVVAEFIKQRLRTYISLHPQELLAQRAVVRIPRVAPPAVPQNYYDWVQVRLAESERLLWTKTCAECHTLNGKDPLALPAVQEAKLTPTWLDPGSFDHTPHKMLACTGCHTQVENSEKTSDVLIPGIKTCQTCHSPSARNISANAECVECHRYHDWSKEKPRHGALAVPKS